ncbi:hypothetical protein SAMN06265379_10891 [Saccharicrinis carchari]|uniref:Uncharacterized protein n=1 Tax=Saccharicrinis carchari TaxID=1168039 RepID=A0A521EBG0_SACCC|nr:hypothetical protein [Saccharicrinis carchari]SMO81237.1 hypothetical protein SAMN06265379_10891 [Saccharicrinis carchari]
MLLNQSILTLVRKGRYQVQTPEKVESPAVLTIFYLDGDILVYFNENRLADNQQIYIDHFKKLDVFLKQIKQQLRTIEILVTAGLFGFSMMSLIWAEADRYVALLVPALIGTAAWYGRKLLAKGVMNIVYRGFFKIRKRIVFNKDLFSRRKADDKP